MDSAQLIVGHRYAFREKPRPGEPIIKVKLLDKVRRGKVRVLYEEGEHPGLDEYVTSRQLVARWGDRKALLRDEERTQALKQHARERKADRVVAGAVSAVLEATVSLAPMPRPTG